MKKESQWENYLDAQNRIRTIVENPKVAYAGTSGSYSEDATIDFFGENSNRIPYRRFEDVFKSVNDGESDYGVIPIENTTTGSVRDVFDLFDIYNCFIIGETQVKIDHCLLGVKGSSIEDITDIYTHEQSLMQCSYYLDGHPEWEGHIFPNNALAAEFVHKQNDKTKGAIASERAGKVHDLVVLDKKINWLESNVTRFVIIAKHPEHRQSDKISLSFGVGHKPGALVRVLNIFDKYNLNLSKIESRPNRKHNWEYNFFIDIEGVIDQDMFDQAIKEVIPETTQFRYLGKYKSNIS